MGEQENSKAERIVPGCPNIDFTKYKRPKKYKMRFCVDREKDYELEGNFNYKTAKTVTIAINRCKVSSTQASCKTEGEITDFINKLKLINIEFHMEA